MALSAYATALEWNLCHFEKVAVCIRQGEDHAGDTRDNHPYNHIVDRSDCRVGADRGRPGKRLDRMERWVKGST